MKTHFVVTGIVKHKDPAFSYYKTAINCFQKIHPSAWNLEIREVLNKSKPIKDKELIRIKEKVRELVKLFPRAYYYFNIVVQDYPDSVWVQDAKEKMLLIEERTLRYEKIIESITEHAKEVKRVNRMF